MNDFGFIIEGVPVAKGRPRFTSIGGFARTYTPAKTKNAEGMIEWLAINAMRTNSNMELIEEPLIVFLEFRMPIPKSYSKAKTLSCQCGETVPTVKPDADNLAKTVLDAMNKTVYKDDSQIVELIVRKRYADKPCTIVAVKKFKNQGNYYL
jgi:Holliday junction resolvase RusA-like endonuclease